MDTVRQDIRYAIRTLLKDRSFTIITLAMLALGIGANTAIFSMVYGVLLKPLPYRDADRLMTANISLPEERDLRESISAFDDLAVWGTNQYTLETGGDAEPFLAATVSPQFFPLLGEPMLGRTFTASDDREPVVVLTFELWQKQFAGDPAVIGRSINLSRRDYTVIGVMPPKFRYPRENIRFWVPIAPIADTAPQQAQNRALRIFRALAHVRAGVSAAEVQAQVQRLSSRLKQDYPATNAQIDIRFTPIYDGLVGDARLALLVLFATVAVILLIACANIAHLKLVRATLQEREIAIRSAVGAGRLRVVRQLITESVLLGMTGGALGLLLAPWGIDLFRSLGPSNLPRLDEVRINLPVLAFTFAMGLVSGIVFGLVPALKASRVNIEQVLRESQRSSSSRWSRRLQNSLIVTELGLALVVLVAAGLLLKSFERLTHTDAGFQADHLLVTTVELFHYKEPERRVLVQQQVIDAIARLPGVEAAGGSSGEPPITPQRGTRFEVEGDANRYGAYFIGAGPDYFKAIGTPMLQGRAFSEADRAGAPPVVILSGDLARRLFGADDPLGKQIRLINPEQSDEWRAVVGVVQDVKYSGLDDPNADTVYTPFAQTPFLWSYVFIRTKQDPATLMPDIRNAFAAADPAARPHRVQFVRDLMEGSVAQPRFNAILLTSFGVLALILAATGLYGVISYSVTQQEKEIGIRIALGARPADVFRFAMGKAMALTIGGLAAGTIGAIAVTRFMKALLFEIGATDVTTYAAVSVLLSAVALLASYIPAHRAMRVDPAVTLRN